MLENEAVAELQQPQLVTGFINLFYCVTPKELLQTANHNSSKNGSMLSQEDQVRSFSLE
jgi:hypothetical protein